MGYDIYWSGDLLITPPLAPEHLAEITTKHDRNEYNTDFDAYPIWTVYEDSIEWNESTRGEAQTELEYLIKTYFAPLGYYRIDGDVYWDGDSNEDMGVLRVRNNVITEHAAEIIYPGGPDFDARILEAPARRGWRP